MKKYNGPFKKVSTAIRWVLLLMHIAFTQQSICYAQERKLVYDIIRNGHVIGRIDFMELIQGEKKFLSFTSDVKTKFIFSFYDHAFETAAYENGIMVYSSFSQIQNGSDKANKITVIYGKSYKLSDGGVSKLTSCEPIRFNMLLLYTNVPQSISKVYSDNHQKLLDIKKIDENKYRLTLPDGNYNYYTYNNGVCSKVEVERTFFNVQFVLR